MIKNLFKKSYKYILLFIILFVIFITSINLFSQNKKYKITNVISSLNEIENGTIDFYMSKNIKTEDDEETINVVYKSLFDKNYNDKNLLALDGSIGIEAESMKIGIYLPIKMLFNEEIQFSTEVEEVYQTIIEIPENNTKMHGELKGVLSLLDKKYSTFDVYQFIEYFNKSFSSYLKEYKNDYNWISSDEQDVFTGSIGRFSKNISEVDFDYILNEFKENLKEEDSYYFDILKLFIDKIKDDYTFYIFVENNIANKFMLKNGNTEIVLNLKYINFNKKIELLESYDDYGLDLNDYLEKTNFNLLSFFGLNEDGTLNIKTLLQKNFKELMSYMYLSLQYAEAGENDMAQNNINLINGLIESIENTDNISEKDKEIFNNYLDVYKLLRQYTIIYVQQCNANDEEIVEELENSLVDTVIDLSDALNNIGIDINETFGELLNNEEVLEEENIDIIEKEPEIEIIGENEAIEIIDNTSDINEINNDIVVITSEDNN